MTDETTAPPARHASGRFGPGNPGRPPGSRNRMPSRAAAKAILDHFEANRDRLLDDLLARPDQRGLYIRLISRLLPRDLEVEDFETPARTDAEVAAIFTGARVLLDGAGDRRAALAELEAVLLCSGSAANTVGDR
ncbi:MAG TPA: hypothetical protein VGH15_07740 [Caulobacteraceae bacterium]